MIFIRGVDETLTVTEKFLELVPVTDTKTEEDIFGSVALDKGRVGWSRVVSLVTIGDVTSR